MVRRGNLFDESKIIKKDSQPLNNETNQEVKLQSQILPINQIINNIEQQVNNEEYVVKNVIKDNVTNENFPIFTVERNKYTGKVENISSVPKECNIKIDIPKDQLRIIELNNNKYINELQLDLIVLDFLLRTENKNYEFYKNKFDYLSLEMTFANKKKDIIKNMF